SVFRDHQQRVIDTRNEKLKTKNLLDPAENHIRLRVGRLRSTLGGGREACPNGGAGRPPSSIPRTTREWIFHPAPPSPGPRLHYPSLPHCRLGQLRGCPHIQHSGIGEAAGHSATRGRGRGNTRRFSRPGGRGRQ